MNNDNLFNKMAQIEEDLVNGIEEIQGVNKELLKEKNLAFESSKIVQTKL